MASGIKKEPLSGSDLEREILRIDRLFPGHVTISPSIAADVLASEPDSGQGRRFKIDPQRWPAIRAKAAKRIRDGTKDRKGVYPSQVLIAEALEIDERTVRNYDKSERLRIATPGPSTQPERE